MNNKRKMKKKKRKEKINVLEVKIVLQRKKGIDCVKYD
jgi:hypothetical protein